MGQDAFLSRSPYDSRTRKREAAGVGELDVLRAGPRKMLDGGARRGRRACGSERACVRCR